MSYRHAWEIINELNSVSGQLIVEKNSGGKNGGGSRLTSAGETLLKQFEECQNAFETFKSQINQENK